MGTERLKKHTRFGRGLHVFHSFRVWFYIFFTRFECKFPPSISHTGSLICNCMSFTLNESISLNLLSRVQTSRRRFLGPPVTRCAMEAPRLKMETYSRIGLLRGDGNLQSYWTTTRRWKIRVVLGYRNALEKLTVVLD